MCVDWTAKVKIYFKLSSILYLCCHGYSNAQPWINVKAIRDMHWFQL